MVLPLNKGELEGIKTADPQKPAKIPNYHPERKP